MATAKSPTKFRSWSSTDSEDPGDIHRLYDPELSVKSTSRKCVSTWTFSLVILLSCVLFLVGLLVGYYVHERQSLDAQVTGDCHYRGRSDGFTVNQISEAHENIMYFMSAFDIQSKYSRLSTDEDQSSGSRWDVEAVDHIRSEFIRYGLDNVEVEEYEVVVTYPDPSNPNKLEVVNSAGQVKLNFTFDQMPESKVTIRTRHSAETETKHADWSNEKGREIYPYVALSSSGMVEGPLVYGHYGRQVDMLMLNNSGVLVTDSILLLRLGKITVSEKMRIASDWGAVGMLLYVDPADLNYKVEDEVKVTPYASAGEHNGASLKISSIPAQTVTMEMASSLMRTLDGRKVPKSWRGGLNVTYRLQPSASNHQRMRLMVNNKQTPQKIRHVIGSIQGDMETDRFVIVGSSRTKFPSDVHGNMGTAHLLELAHSLTQVKNLEKWEPRRGVKFISWGGNEFSGIGQAEFLKVNNHILKMKAVAYIDLDLTIHQGQKSDDPIFKVTTNKLLTDLVEDVVSQVPDPTYPENRVADHWSGVQQYRKSVDASSYLHGNRNHLYRIQEMGIPVVQCGYILPISMKTEDSLQDDRHHFRYHLAAARVISLVLLSLVDDKVLMYNVQHYTAAINNAVKKSSQILHQNGKYNIEKLLLRADTLEKTGQAFQEYIMTMGTTEVPLDTRDINDVMMLVEKTFVSPTDLRRYTSMLYETTDNGQLSLLQDVVSLIKAGDKWTDLRCVVDLLTTALDQCNAALQLS